MLVAFIRVHLYPEYMCGRVEAARLFLLPCLFTSSRSGKSRTRNFGRRHGLHGLRVVSNCHHRSAQFGPMAKPAKNKIEKFVKLTDHSYACNSLTNFEYEAHTITGNGNQSAESCLEKLVKSHLVNLLLAGLNPLEPLCRQLSSLVSSLVCGCQQLVTIQIGASSVSGCHLEI